MAASIRRIREAVSLAKITQKLPDRLKTGAFAKAGNYVHGLGVDYKNAVKDIFIDAKNYPLRATVYITTLTCATYAWSKNPDENNFDKSLLDASNDLVLLSDAVRNPDSEAFIRRVTVLRNEGVLRRMNLLVGSVMWWDNYDKDVAMYDAQCDHLKVKWRNFQERILDVGFHGRWWYLNKAMEDYDINYKEWEGREAEPMK
ncbi:mitochondrial import inner membrane translocase subunit Tim29-like [Amphiura filiformis]|uniref:mitochondrial import inner membrane translocase subunit Tim29-like n=1 Tax=Amphiura filiformis TaxID=82378 RepID=UPI003B2232FF